MPTLGLCLWLTISTNAPRGAGRPSEPRRSCARRRRETLAHSLEGRPVPLITITGCTPPEMEGVAAGDSQSRQPEPADPELGKPVVFVSARVHPAETMAQWMLDGILELLLRPAAADPRAAELRRRFVFKLVPCVYCAGAPALRRHGLSISAAAAAAWPKLRLFR
jgi:hypothetical protein